MIETQNNENFLYDSQKPLIDEINDYQESMDQHYTDIEAITPDIQISTQAFIVIIVVFAILLVILYQFVTWFCVTKKKEDLVK